ncbi:MAG: ACP S-malonyltransferase [Acutalibacteraceae bacterium]|nr:ACP S-malonyltransferase [Acutalibacteraceae bacterium]
MITYMFPGQGSQAKGMGEQLFSEFPDLVKKADELLGYSIQELCLEDPYEQLNLTQYTQPALYIVNALSYFHKINETGRKPDFVAGHSLGEYNALLAAEVFDFETGLRLVKKRGELMGQASGGAMAAVLKLNEAKVRNILWEYGLDNIDIANLNSEGQIVISGKVEDIDYAKTIFEKEGAGYVKLTVGAAFHSRYMVDAKAEFGEYIKNFRLSAPKIPIISNVTALPHESYCIEEKMVEQLCAPVRWTDSVRYLLEQGCEDFEELGPGKVLTKLVNRIKLETPSVQKREKVVEVSAIAQKKENKLNYHKFSDDVHEKVVEWNKRYPVGTKIICNGYPEKLVTRTEAMVLFGHRAAIYVENYNGYFDLEEITPA